MLRNVIHPLKEKRRDLKKEKGKDQNTPKKKEGFKGNVVPLFSGYLRKTRDWTRESCSRGQSWWADRRERQVY